MDVTIKREDMRGRVAMTGLAKVISGNMDDALTIKLGQPAYDPKNHVMYLPGLPGDDIEGDTLRLFRAFLSHESWERGKSKWLSDPRFLSRKTEGLKWLINALNDARIDTEGADEWPGSGMNIRFALKQDWAELLDDNQKEPVKPSVKMIACLFRYVGFGIATPDECFDVFPQLGRHLKVVEPWLRNIDLSSEDRCIVQGIEIYDALRKDAGKDKSQPEADGESPGEGIPDTAETDRDIDQSMLNRLAEDMLRGQDFDRKMRHGENYESYLDRLEVQVYSYDPTHDTVRRASKGRTVSPSEYEQAAHVLMTRMRQALTVPAPRMRRRQRKGYVDERSLHRIVLGDEDVMKRPLKRESDDIAAALSLDLSSSMAYKQRIQKVKLLSLAWVKALSALNIPSMVHGWYSEDPRHVYDAHVYRQEAIVHILFKEFEDILSDDVLSRISSMASAGGTPTGEGIAFSLDKLSRQRARRKVLFVLTDGEPALMANGPVETHFQYIETVLERARRAGIEVVGVGINTDVSKIFDAHLRVDDVKALQGVVSDRLVTVLREGKRRIAA